MLSLAAISRPLVLLPVMALSSCVVGPDFKKPEMDLPESFSEKGVTWKRQDADSLPDPEKWWKIYKDSTLNHLVEKALKQNQTIASASARLDEARALSGVARSRYFPSITLEPGAKRTKSVFRGPQGGSIYFNSYTVPLEMSYEVDAWGKVRRQVEQAKANKAAAEESLNALKLSVAGEVAQTYWALRAVDADRDVLARTLEVRGKALELLTKQRDAGQISGLDLARAETEVATAEADRIRLDQDRAVLVNALAVLTGSMATNTKVAENGSLPDPPAIPTTLPSKVITQRPDVRVALHQVAAANAEIGVATAALYPSITLNGSTGYDAGRIGDLFNPASMVWSMGSSALFQLSGQKLLREQRESKRAAHRAVTADYRQTVIESIAEAENALQAMAIIQRRQAAQDKALVSARKTFDLSGKRYESGLVSFLDVVDAERTLLEAERNSNAIRAERLGLSVSLIKAIGGKWN